MIFILYAVYIIHQNSGVCLISEIFSPDKYDLDSDLISGYLVAFKDVGKEMSKGSGDLKVIDMDVYNLILVFQKDVLTIGVADKSDDKMILFHNLSKLQSKFVKRYNSQSELDYWDGQLLKFRDFNGIIKRVLKDGLIGEIKKTVPIFKIYRKDFLKLLGKEKKKKLEIQEENYKEAFEIEKKKQGSIEKRFPKQPIAQGLITSLQYKIAHLLNGFNTAEDISNKMNLPIEDVYRILKSIDDLGLLSYIEIV